MENNVAFKATLGNITKIEGADKIVQAIVMLDGVPVTQVVTGVDTIDGTPIVYFDSNMCLSETFLADNPELKTYLAKGNRVRCIKLKGVISNGLAVSVDKFARYTKTLPDSFTSLEGVEICKKWLPNTSVKSTTPTKKGKRAASRVVLNTFHFHVDTEQLARNIHKVSPEDIISISRKAHGTSAITSYVPVKRKLTFFDKVAKLFKVTVQETEYDYLYASRTVIKNAASGTGFYGTDLWTDVGKAVFCGKLHKGESVYYEIVGYIPNTSKFIQKNYDYGCKQGEYKVAVYRITQVNEDGIVTEYSWASMKERCKELGAPMVEEYYFGKAKDLFAIPVDNDWRMCFLTKLRQCFLEKDCVDNICKKMPDEGIVIRREAKDISVFKLKSERFFLQESSGKDAGEVDVEEQEASI